MILIEKKTDSAGDLKILRYYFFSLTDFKHQFSLNRTFRDNHVAGIDGEIGFIFLYCELIEVFTIKALLYSVYSNSSDGFPKKSAKILNQDVVVCRTEEC